MHSCALASMFLIAATAACSSSSSGDTSTGTDTGSSGETSSGDTGGPKPDSTPPSDTTVGTDTSTPIDTGTAVDTGGGTDTTPPPTDTGTCDMPAGGAPCDPGVINCAGTSCDTTTHFCCAKDAATGTCLADGAACADNAIHCDEKADCPGGQLCCLVAKGLTSADLVCQAACTGGLFSAQVCKTNSECSTGTCIVQTCSGSKVEACSAIPGC